MAERLLINRLREAELLFIPTTTLKLRDGGTSDIYVDVKKAYGNPDLLRHITRVIVGNLDPRTSFIAGSGHGGISLATTVSQETDLPLSLVRDEPKDHGLEKVIDGYMPSSGDLASVVDDVFTTGNSLGRTCTGIEEAGAKILGCHVIILRGDALNFPHPVSHLFTIDELRP